MRKSRCLFILPSLNGGGSERVITTLLHVIDRERFAVTLVLLQHQGDYIDDIPPYIDTINLDVSHGRYAPFKLLKLFKREKPDIVLSTLGFLNVVISLIIPFASKNITFIARESNTVSIKNKQEKYPRLFNFLYRHFYSNFDRVIAQSHYMKNDLVDHYRIPEKMINVILNPVDIDRITTLSSVEEQPFAHDRINLLSVGSLTHQKGYDLLLEAVALLNDTFHLTILGKGPLENELTRIASDLNISERVTFRGFETNPYKFMKNADILILSSRYEGLPNVVLEANLCGLPVIAFDSPGGTGEIIENGFNGVLVEDGNVNALADAIKGYDINAVDKRAISDRIVDNFNSMSISKRYEEVFTDE